MKKVREVLRLHLRMQLSSRKIQGATGVARTTVQEYIKRCNETEIILDELDAMNFSISDKSVSVSFLCLIVTIKHMYLCRCP